MIGKKLPFLDVLQLHCLMVARRQSRLRLYYNFIAGKESVLRPMTSFASVSTLTAPEDIDTHLANREEINVGRQSALRRDLLPAAKADKAVTAVVRGPSRCLIFFLPPSSECVKMICCISSDIWLS